VWAALLGASLRAQLRFRRSFLLESVGKFWVNALEAIAVLVLFEHVDAMAGFTKWQVVYLYGVASLALGLAELLTDGLDEMPALVRYGGLDGILVRPVSPLLQVAGRQFRPLHAGRAAQGALALGVALVALGDPLGPLQVAMIGVNVAAATVVFAAVFLAEAATTVFTIQSAEAFNAFSYGGVQLAQYPLGVYGRGLRWLFLWVIPVGLAVYGPALAVLRADDPLGLPPATPYLAPLCSALFAAVALRYWRFALDRYRGTGS
jgi:ABC-2 type transport system permease protein